MSDPTISNLRSALVGELLDQIENGSTAVDKETGEAVKVSTPASILGVAAKVVKDFAAELDAGKEEAQKAERLMDFLAKRKSGFQAAAPN